MKVCSKCKQEKEETAFARNIRNACGLNHVCRSCKAQKDADYYAANSERVKARARAYNKECKDGLRVSAQTTEDGGVTDYAESAREAALAASTQVKEVKATYNKVYYTANKKALRAQQTQYKRKRRDQDPVFDVVMRIQSLVYRSLVTKGHRKDSKTFAILGCTPAEFALHLGDKLENAQLDHICPMAQAVTEEEVLKLNHFSNFRWLSAEENLAKSDNWTPEGEQKCLELLNRPWNHKGDDNGR